MKAAVFFRFSWLMLILLCGCDGNFTQVVEVNRKGIETKGVVFGLLSNSDIRDSVFFEQNYDRDKNGIALFNRIYVSHSSPSSQPQNVFYGGKVELRSESGDLDIQYFETDNKNTDKEPFFAVLSSFEPGNVYFLTARCEGQKSGPKEIQWTPVAAIDTMPLPVEIQIENAEVRHPDLEGTVSEGFIDIKIKDEPYRFNAYQVEISVIQNVTNENGLPYTIIIPAVVEGSEDRVNSEVFGTYHLNLMTQAAFNRQGQRRINFTFPANNSSFNRQKPVTLMIRLSNLSDNYLEFVTSSRQYYANGDNPFAEPTEIYSNIDNGYGIFAFSTRSFAEIIVE
ncbi:MAG TPA: DUF4249 family protein [Membranihabitans sp.]|nr:DUF4249 family protein [Membranihabitans sp.]